MKKIVLLMLAAVLLVTVQPSWVKMDGVFKQIDADGDKLCGVNPGNMIFCKNSLNAAW